MRSLYLLFKLTISELFIAMSSYNSGKKNVLPKYCLNDLVFPPAVLLQSFPFFKLFPLFANFFQEKFKLTINHPSQPCIQLPFVMINLVPCNLSRCQQFHPFNINPISYGLFQQCVLRFESFWTVSGQLFFYTVYKVPESKKIASQHQITLISVTDILLEQLFTAL